MSHIARGELTRTFFPQADFDALLTDGTLALNGKAIDADVRIGISDGEGLQVRLVGVPSPKGYCFFLTNLPARIGPLQVGDIYRIRWEVELSFKLDKTSYRLDKGKGERTCSIKALLHASLISSIITGLLVHKHNIATRPVRAGAPRTVPPIHHGLVARCLVQWAYSIARIFELEGAAAEAEWNRLANNLTYAAKDPAWRSQPSVLDRVSEDGELMHQNGANQPPLRPGALSDQTCRCAADECIAAARTVTRGMT